MGPIEGIVEITDFSSEISGHKNTTLDLKKFSLANSAIVVDCSNVRIELSEKMSKLTLLNCNDVTINAHTLITGVEITGCNKVNIYVEKKLPSLVIDKSDSISAYVPSETAKDLKITTAKSGDMNLNINDNDGNSYEVHIPSQFEHVLDDSLKKLIHQPSSFY